MLEEEFRYYLDNQDELGKKYSGRVVIIVGENVVGDYSNYEEALFEARKKYKGGTFLIQECTVEDDVCTEMLPSAIDIIKHDTVEEKIIVMRGIPVILDSDVAKHYGVETRDINKAVKNNPDKFPKGYIIEIQKEEKNELVEIFHRFNKLKHSTVLPTAFTEQGLYMLATILKSKKATEKTIEIVETFARMRELSRVVNQMTQEADKEKQKPLLKRSGELISDLLDNDLKLTDTETSIELNLAMLKIKHTTKRSKK